MNIRLKKLFCLLLIFTSAAVKSANQPLLSIVYQLIQNDNWDLFVSTTQEKLESGELLDFQVKSLCTNYLTKMVMDNKFDVGRFNYLIAKGAWVHNLFIYMNPSDQSTKTSLVGIAAEYGNKDMVRALLAIHADTNQFFNIVYSPVYLAAHNKHLAVVKYLLQEDKKTQELFLDYEKSPLTAAFLKCDDGVVSCFMSAIISLDKEIKESIFKNYISNFKSKLESKELDVFSVNENKKSISSILNSMLKSKIEDESAVNFLKELTDLCVKVTDTLVAYSACAICNQDVSFKDLVCLAPCGHDELHRICYEQLVEKKCPLLSCQKQVIGLLNPDIIIKNIQKERALKKQYSENEKMIKSLTLERIVQKQADEEKERECQKEEYYKQLVALKKVELARQAQEDDALKKALLEEQNQCDDEDDSRFESSLAKRSA